MHTHKNTEICTSSWGSSGRTKKRGMQAGL